MLPVQVHIEQITPRATYAVGQLLGRLLGWQVILHDRIESLAQAEGPKLVYGRTALPGAFHIIPAGLLERTDLEPVDPEVMIHHGIPALFPTAEGDLPFDPFSGAFYLLSRMEEYTSVPHDAHHRPVTDLLHGARDQYLHRPVVDEWALLLAKVWKAMDASVPAPVRSYQHVFTLDLDNGFKYLGRPAWRTWGSMIRDVLAGRMSELGERSSVLLGRRKDPYDIYSELKEKIPAMAHRAVFFVLHAPRGTHDHAVPIDDPQYASRLQDLASWAEVGVHASYRTMDDAGRTAREASGLGTLLKRPVVASRQHFLRMRLPATYRELIAAGIQEDHTMGLHDRVGFRAGTCTPFSWYDLEHERMEDLTIHPFAVMDNTLRHKLLLSPEAAVTAAGEALARVRAVNGTFTGLWHESFMGHDRANQGWRAAILEILHEARA